ncbi:MAG: alpha/beta hydrolase, partial [Pseudomonadota bacterium]
LSRQRQQRPDFVLAQSGSNHYYKMDMDALRTLQTTDGVTLGYRVLRQSATPRQTLVLLHGMASNITRWSEFIEQTALKRDWDILCPDLRGHGASFTRRRLDLDHWCRDLLALLDTEGVDRAVLIGHSLGAQVAVHFAARHPGRVRGLALIDPVFHEALRGTLRAANFLRPAIQALAAVILMFNRLGLRRRRIPGRDLRKMDEATRAKLLQRGKQEEMVALYSSPWEDLKYFPVGSYLQELLAMIRPLPALARIPAPVLALLSSGITYTDPQTTRALLAENPRTRIVTIDAYHWPLTENPVQVREAIETWCNTLR